MDGELIMRIFERPMRKVFRDGKLKEYTTTLGSTTEIEDSLFYKNKNGKMVCDVIICFPKEYEELMEDHENLQSQISDLEEKLDSKNKRIEILENRLSSIDEDHQKEMKKMDSEYSERIDELKEEVHEKDLEIERTKTEYEKEIGQINKAHLNHVNGLKLFDEEKHILIKDHDEEISRLKESLFNPESDMKIEDHNLKINTIKNKIVEGIIPHNNNIERLDSINIWKYFKGELNDIKKDLKKDMNEFKDIAHYIESKNENVIVEIKKEEDDDGDSSSD